MSSKTTIKHTRPESAPEPSLLPTAAAYQVLARRYRSRSFDEVVGQESIAATLKGAIAQGRTAHAYLFCGTRGVGKTSMARIFARALNAVDSLSQKEAISESILRGEDMDVIEIDGASNRGIDDARDLIAASGMSPARSPYKIYIIDEVHMLTQPAFNALLKTMEEPPAHVKFILCTTEPFRVPATIQSRCQRFDFRAISTASIARHLTEVLLKEGVSADDAVILQVARLANGSMRDGLSLIDRLASAAGGHISAALAREVLGLPDEEILESILAAIAQGEPAAGLEAASKLLSQGMSPDHAIDTIAARLHDALLVRVCGAETNLVELPKETRERIATHAERFSAPALVHLIALCDASVRNIRGSSIPRAIFDAVIARACLWQHFAKAASLLAGDAPPAPAKKKLTESSQRADVAPAVAAVPSAAEADALRRHPLVRQVAELLDAAVTRVAPGSLNAPGARREKES
ncbi:MAG: DNA polymerase III subunit gamma/tau [Phycisphaerales bacterium]|nr:DNA polymerase III subunit gamma/tau [Phycisphaerales bacterium]